MAPYWSIEEKRIDPSVVFRALPKHFPGATTMFLEGTSIADEVKECLRSHVEEGPHLPGRQTKWPKAELFRCRFSPELCAALESLSERHAEPELCDHLYVYRGEQPLMDFPDFCASNIFLPESMPESQVRAFAEVFGLRYEKRYDG